MDVNSSITIKGTKGSLLKEDRFNHRRQWSASITVHQRDRRVQNSTQTKHQRDRRRESTSFDTNDVATLDVTGSGMLGIV